MIRPQIIGSSHMKTKWESTKGRKWKVTQGKAVATVVADTFALALERARHYGFNNPDSIVLIG